MSTPSRRTFLKTSGLAALAATVPVTGGATQEKPASHAGDTAPKASHASSLVELVNILQGTNSTSYFSRGNTLPIAALPFGMAHWTLQSRAYTPWMFQPADRRIDGFRCTHQLSPWLSDYGQAIFLPFTGDVNPEPAARASSYRPEDAKLFPHSMKMRLLRYRVDAELVPTERCALITTKFEKSDERGFLIDIPGKTGELRADEATHTIYFESKVNEGGVPKNFATYYVVRFAEPWQHFEMRDLRTSRVGILRFGKKADVSLEARVATSFISYEQAQRNLDRELGHQTAEALRSAAETRWNVDLGRIEVEGGTEKQLKTFYSCMYRAMLFPRTFHEPDDAGKPHHFSAFNGTVVPGVMYADHGYWDVYRAWYPFMSIVYPERLGEILQAWVNAYKEGGWMPQFPAPGYRACMSGSLIDSLFADAVVKGIPGFDVATAYEGLRKHATMAGDPDKGYGRQGIDYYLRLNYLPADRVDQSVAESADAAYGDFCIAQIAGVLGKKDDAQMFNKRSENWRQLFDPQTGFLRGKKEDGSWIEPFDAFTWGSPYEEGGAWQHRWDVPHDIPGLIEALGGKEKAAAALKQMLTLPPDFNVGVYGQEIHEMSEMAAIPFGQYSHNNQPVHHVLYLFVAAGRPDQTQYWVRRALDELYSPEQFSGDEDTGSMAAWYILSAMGFYQVCPGKPEYTFGSPLFARVSLHLAGKKTTVIEAHGQSPRAVYVNGIQVDGKANSTGLVAHEDLVRGAHITFSMQENRKS